MLRNFAQIFPSSAEGFIYGKEIKVSISLAIAASLCEAICSMCGEF